MFQSRFWEKLSVQLGIPNAAAAQNGGREVLARDSGKERFTLDELEKLYAILASNPSIHESNRSVVVETIRSIAEVRLAAPCNHQTLPFLIH
jgi:hypothetical protein